MARHTERKRTQNGRIQTIERRCARHAKTGTLTHTRAGHARSAQ